MRAARLLVIPAVLAVFLLPALSPGAQFVYRDTGRMHEPTKRFIAAELAQGRLPEWNPYGGLGAPLIAGAIDAALHPFNALLVALPVGGGFKVWILASFLAAAMGGCVWGRALGLRHEAAVLGGLVFALSGPFVSSSDNVTYLTTFAALPWYFAATHAFVTTGGPPRLAAVMAAAFVLAAGGDPQAWGIALLATVPYALLVRGEASPSRTLQRALPAVAMAFAASGPVVLPVVAWLADSQRGVQPDAVDLARWNLSPLRLTEFLVPGLFRTDPADPESSVFHHFCGTETDTLPWFLSVYLGAGALALALLGARRRRWAAWLLAAAIPFTWAALGPRAGFGQLALQLPLLRGFRYWEKLAIWPGLLIAICAAAGLHALLERPSEDGPRLTRASGVAGAALFAVAGLAAVPGLVARLAGGGGIGAQLGENLVGGALHAAAILSIVAIVALALARGRLGERGGAALAAVVVLDLIGANVGAYVLGRAPPAAPPPLAAVRGEGGLVRVVTAFDLREDRWPRLGKLEGTWEWGRRTLEPSWNVGAGVGNFRHYVGLRDRRLDRATRHLAGLHQWAPVGLWGIRGVVVPGRPELAERVGLSPPFTPIAEDAELPAWIVAMAHRPRAYLAGKVASVDEEGAFAFAMAGGASGESVVEGAIPPGMEAGAGDARVLLDQPGRLELAVRADRPGLLVVNDAFAPGWSATVDGRPAETLRANYLARGVWVGEGAHAVTFAYRTPWLREGLLVALLGGAVLAGWEGARRLRARRP